MPVSGGCIQRNVLRAFGAIYLCVAPAVAAANGGPIIGASSLSYDYQHKQFYVSGWACQQGIHASIAVHIYVDRSAYDRPPGTRVAMGMADKESEPAVNQACQDNGSKHRFLIDLPPSVFASGEPRKLFTHGIRPAGNGENSAVSGSGVLQQPARFTRTDGPFRPVAGSYVSSAAHPRVFTTSAELSDLARRIGTSGSYSAKRFEQLEAQVAHDLAAPNRIDATYSGCSATVYQYAFSYEPQDGNAGKVRDAMKLAASETAPAGAAVVASRLALYGALVKAGAKTAPGAPDARKAIDLAKKIMVVWSEHGFRNERNQIRTMPTEFCDDQGKPIQAGVGLIIGRGIVYSVQALDLLLYVDTLNGQEVKAANEFHAAMYELVRNSLNSEFKQPVALCDHYNNQSANAVAGLLALARLLDDGKKFTAALNGDDPSIPVSIPWNALVNGAIYGDNDVPNMCRTNTGADSLSSKPFFETPTVAPGEIDDRFRNLHPQQGIGYPMFTLERIVDSAEVLKNAGFDGYGYRGTHGQSIALAIDYYACYAKGAGFGKTVTEQNSAACPNAAQYDGKVVNGVDQMVTIGAYRLPNDASLKVLELDARQAESSGPFALDGILFGKWRD